MKKSALVFTLMAAVLMMAMMAASGCGDKKETAETAAASTPAQATPSQASAQPADPNKWQGTVLETMNSGGYTYVYLDTGSEKIWAAGPETQLAVGQQISMDKGMAMPEFHAKSLDRTFDVIYFVGSISGPGGAGGMGRALPEGHPETGMETGASHSVVDQADIPDVAKLAGGYSIEEVFAQSAALEGQTVKVRGQVVKFTPNIMGTNWVHIQDGTGSGATADLTVTTSDVVAAGDLVVVEGALTVNKDFGAGYKYDAIIEGASVTKE